MDYRPPFNPRKSTHCQPDTIDGAAYITCFLSLADPTDLSAVEALGVRVKDRYRGMEVRWKM